jgi:hypothetical protein
VTKRQAYLFWLVVAVCGIIGGFASSRAQSPVNGQGSNVTGAGSGGVSLAPSATQTITSSANSFVPLQIQQSVGGVGTFLSLLDSTSNSFFSIGTVSNGQNSRNPIVKIGQAGVGPNEYAFNAGTVVSAGVVGANGLPLTDFPIMIDNIATTPTTPVASTNILGNAVSLPAGLYEVTAYYVLTTAGVGGTAITLNLSWTDAQQAQTDSTLTSSGLVLGQFAYKTFIVQQQASGNVTYTITETGTFSTHPVLALKTAIKRVG